MKKVFQLAGAFLVSAFVLGSCNGGKDGSCCVNTKVESHMDSVAYSFGFQHGTELGGFIESLPGDSLPLEAFFKGFVTAVKKDTVNSILDTTKMIEILQAYNMELEKIRRENLEKIAIMNKIKSDSALTANKAAEGVVTTASGLQYRVIKEGDGRTPKANDTVFVHYVGKLVDGTIFDASANHGPRPAVFVPSQVIPGWTEGLQLMKLGSKYEFLIPSELAYGERGGRAIEPNSALWFEVELIDVRPAKK